MPNSVNITYGPYNFRTQAGPIPFPTITQTFLRSDDGTKIGSRYSMTLNGTLFATGVNGYQIVDGMQDALLTGLSLEGQELQITCDSTVLLSVYPRITDIRLDQSNDNWTITTPYTITMEWPGENYSGYYVDNVNETWNLQFSDDNSYYNWTLDGGTGDYNSVLLNISHQVNAKGAPPITSTGLLKPAYLAAKDFVISRLGYNASEVAQVGVLNLNASLFAGYNHLRVVEEDKFGGTYSVTENWIAVTGSPAVEDFTATVRYNPEDGLTNVDIQGSIQGLETRSYGSTSGAFTITQNKYQAASGYWDVVRPKLLGRAKFAAGTTDVNPIALDTVIGLNPTRGVINYAYQYNNRPCNFITGSLSERIVVSDAYPTDVFGSIAIPGRAGGPILQDLNTITEHKRSVSIDVLMAKPSGCSSIISVLATKPTGQVTSLLCALEQDIESLGVRKFKSADSDSFDIKTGRYTRNVEWTFSYCTGTPPNTSFCG